VRVFRAAAVTVAESIAKGQPVTVHGRFKSNTWESDTGPRMDLVIDATSVGHDLTRGVATFSRATGATELPPEALPAGVAPDAGDGEEPDVADAPGEASGAAAPDEATQPDEELEPVGAS
jgi:single-strand DNA-binding protein